MAILSPKEAAARRSEARKLTEAEQKSWLGADDTRILIEDDYAYLWDVDDDTCGAYELSASGAWFSTPSDETWKDY